MASRIPGFLDGTFEEDTFGTEFSVAPATINFPALPGIPGGLKFYGNYCGPGHGDPTGITPPIDDVDAVCRAHDRCYQIAGSLACSCDRALIMSMPAAIAATSTSAQGKRAGRFIRALFRQTFCQDPSCPPACLPFGGFCIPVSGIGRGGQCLP
jgi:hypothetical protein